MNVVWSNTWISNVQVEPSSVQELQLGQRHDWCILIYMQSIFAEEKREIKKRKTSLKMKIIIIAIIIIIIIIL